MRHTTSPCADRLADIQAHLMSGGTVQTVTPAGVFCYDRRQLGWFVADAHGLYVTMGSGQGCLNTCTITLD